MGARNKKGRFVMSSRLLDYGFDNFQFMEIDSLPEPKTIPVKLGGKDSVQITLSSSIPFVFEKDTDAKISFTYFLSDSIQAPAAYRTTVGWVEVSANEKYRQSVPVVTAEQVSETKSWIEKFFGSFFQKRTKY